MSASPVKADTADQITISIPSNPMYVAVIRLTATALSSRLGFSLDANEDLKLAVDEAATLVLEVAEPDSVLTSTFSVDTSGLQVTVEAPAAQPPNEDSYSWGVLTALTHSARADHSDHRARISFDIAGMPAGE